MKLLTCRSDREHGPPLVAALLHDGQTVVFLKAAAEAHGEASTSHFASMLALLEAGPAAMEKTRELVALAEAERPAACLAPLADLTLLAPLPRPSSLRDCLSYERHLTQCMQTAAHWRSPALGWVNRLSRSVLRRPLLRPPAVWYERPLYYKGNPRSVVGPEAEVVWPSYTEKLDFELEFGLFIGKQGYNISPVNAMEYVAGYSLFNDFSARDVQLHEMQGRLGPAKGKDFDTGNAMGPYLVTTDEIDNPYQLTMQVRVNDEIWTECSTAEIQHRIPEIVSYISQDETLYPGDFIGVGTLPGGCGLELDRWLSPGDTISLESAELGVLRNTIAMPQMRSD
ncbi:fumarylacetoacetate hydrolase family protein [Lignipirellula cremea]|uniref:Ureidoglycolate lyase n=1 Tax=Lignipirellula cremea TaxID=2528010 RepID=A0A518DW58_9BACT|nr:fumarylacetoacetate hydrolase family protein [Lignipirellula cremea]QDU96072.1 Ureidoglycolate lyase [Lignipirellula cremea]